MNAAEMSKHIGNTFWLKIDDLYFRVEVMDMRERFGITDAQIIPVDGAGMKWVEFSRLKTTAP